MLPRVVIPFFVLALAPSALANDPPVTPIPGCGAAVVLETGFPRAAPEGQANIAEHVPVACPQ